MSAGGFDAQPTLRGGLVHLRPLRAEDFDALFAVASDPLIWAQHPDRTRSTEAGFRVFFEGAMASHGALLALDARDGRVIGSSRYHGFDPSRSEIEIGWTFLARSHWGGVVNGEMKILMLAHAFRFVENVIFVVAPNNHRSQRAVEKIGGVRVGVRNDPDGADRLVFALTADGFRARTGTGRIRHAREPVFGRREDGVHHVERAAAYAVVLDASRRVACVTEASGLYLPGGGLEPGEDAALAVVREVAEECGRTLTLIRLLCRATQFHRTADGAAYELHATFFRARFGAPLGVAQLDLTWHDTAPVQPPFFHECHGWAVEQALAREADENRDEGGSAG